MRNYLPAQKGGIALATTCRKCGDTTWKSEDDEVWLAEREGRSMHTATMKNVDPDKYCTECFAEIAFGIIRSPEPGEHERSGRHAEGQRLTMFQSKD